MATKRKKGKQVVWLRVTEKGHFVVADELSLELCRRRKYRVGTVLAADLQQDRDHNQWRRLHKLGQLLAESIDEFAGWGAHKVIKRIQWEGNISCEELLVDIPGYGPATVRIPDTLAPHEMDEGEFQEVYAEICQAVINRYWPELSSDEIDNMATLVGTAAG